MNKKELDFILQGGEGLKIEFKESIKNIDKEIAALANAEGGRIFIGITDDNRVKGTHITNSLKSQVQDIANNCDPPIKIKLEEFDRILIINVEEGKDKPYKCSSGFYLRQGPNSQKMKTSDIKDMVLGQGRIKFDNQEREFEFKDFDEDAFKDYLRRLGTSPQINKKDILFNIGVLKENKLNNAGILFFSKNPKKYLINAYITCARYKGTEKVKVIDRKDLETNLVAQVEDSIKFIERNTKLEYEIKGLYRKEIPEYPVEALREAVLNAVMHRDYLETGANVQIDIFDDRIAITNIGGLIKPLTKDKLGKIAVRRNPLIADLFHRISLVEKMGTGIKKIRDECKKHGNVKFQIETNGYFIAAFKLKSRERLGENKLKILGLIKKDQKTTVVSISKNLGLSTTAVEKNISQLKKNGMLKRIGPAKGGYWEVNV